MFYIEFIGIPGVGKSTMMDTFLKEARKQKEHEYLGTEEAFHKAGVGRLNKIYRLLSVILPRSIEVKITREVINMSLIQFDAQNEFLARHGKALKAFLDSSEFSGLSYEDRKIVIGGYLSTASTYQMILDEAEDGVTVFFDEGMVQKSMMFVSHQEALPLESEHLLEYLRHTPLPDLTIYLKADLENSRSRMMTRSKGLTKRLKKIDNDYVLKFLANAHNHMERVASFLKTEGKTVVEVDNNNSVDEAVRILLKQLPRYIQG